MRHTIRQLFRAITAFIRDARTNRSKCIILIIIVGALGLIVFNMMRNNAQTSLTEQSVRGVDMRTISELAGGSTEISLTGTVESQFEADIRAEAQGQIVSVYKQIGSTVRAGEIIAEIENSFERAQVAQAQASVDLAVASRNEQSSITGIELDNARRALEQERVSAVNTIVQVYTLAESALYGKADQFFENPRTSAPHLKISSYGIGDLPVRRAQIGDSLITWNTRMSTLTASGSVDSDLADAEERLRFMSTFMRDMADIVTRQGSSAQITDILSGRSSIDTAVGAISSARASLRSAETSYRLAQERNIQTSGDTGLTTREASVRQAEASRAIALASLEKKIIRAPLSGTINSLSIAQGDVVSPGQAVAVVANNNALRIKTYITEQEKDYIAIGALVRIGDTYSGRVVALSPALDPLTRKIEVIIGVVETETSRLVNGQSVRVAIARTGNTEDVDVSRGVRIPISALNIGTQQTVIYGIDEESRIVAYPVSVGTVFGDSVLIIGDIDPNVRIVLDARGLKVGDTVIVRE